MEKFHYNSEVRFSVFNDQLCYLKKSPAEFGISGLKVCL